MRLLALYPFHHGEAIARGEVFDVSDNHALQLISKGLAQPFRPPGESRSMPPLAQPDTWVCIASGPSLTAEDCALVGRWRDRVGGKVIAVNGSWRLAPWADVIYGMDRTWWKRWIEEIRSASTARRVANAQPDGEALDLEVIPGVKRNGLGRKRPHLAGNSGHAAINLAFLWGARRIVLLGYDMQMTGGRSHFHDEHPWDLTERKPPTMAWVPRYAQLATDLAAEGVEVINATRETALGCFERRPLAEVLGG